MRVIIQKVNEASVFINKKKYSEIGEGYLLLVGFTHNDDEQIIDKMIEKIINLRILHDENGKSNLSILKEELEILSVSQFTLYADAKKGRRPSFVDSARPEKAEELYEVFNEKLKRHIPTKTGVFQADMQVSLINDGPMTIILDSEEMGWHE